MTYCLGLKIAEGLVFLSDTRTNAGVVTIDTPVKDALKAAMVSMDSTLRSNLFVGMLLDLSVIRGDTLDFKVQRGSKRMIRISRRSATAGRRRCGTPFRRCPT